MEQQRSALHRTTWYSAEENNNTTRQQSLPLWHCDDQHVVGNAPRLQGRERLGVGVWNERFHHNPGVPLDLVGGGERQAGVL